MRLTLQQTVIHQYAFPREQNNWTAASELSHHEDSVYKKPEDWTGQLNIAIDIYAPVNKTLAEVKKLIEKEQKYRKLNAKKSGITKDDIANWIDAKLLQYTDLKLWGMATQQKISNQIIADILWPTGRRYHDGNAKKVEGTIVYFKRCINNSFLRELSAQN